jgi:tryptophan-rich sensory protein
MNSKVPFIVAGLVLLLIYMVGSGLWVNTGDGWYRSLNAPSWQPPDWVFGTIWPYNFLMIGISTFAVASYSPATKSLWLVSFGLSVVAALVWANQFYVSHRLWMASIALACVPIFTSAMTRILFANKPLLGLFFLPYQVWVTIATVLSFTYAAKN